MIKDMKTRRAFIKAASQVAITSPAVSILLSVATKPAAAQCAYLPSGVGSCQPILDDFTFGNNEEDIDALNLGSNFNPINGTANLDDLFVP